MRYDVLTIFPTMFDSPLSASILKRARASGAIDVRVHDIRAFARDKHRVVDDTPYGGGAGMVMKPEPLVNAVESVPRTGRSVRVLLTPQGERLNQRIVRELARLDQMILICGRYEGIDERARHLTADREISIGDYVLSGGELAALAVMDAVTRLLPNVLGNGASIKEESFEHALLEYPQYTRPEVFRDMSVPDVLTSGNHADIARWRRRQSLCRTAERRPDLLSGAAVTAEEQAFIDRRHTVDKSGENG